MRFLILILGSFTLFSCSKKEPVDYINPFIGTGGHGHTFPGPTRPFGMVQLGPDTRLTGWDGCSGYHYTDSVIYGFSHTHLSGTGISDYGDVLLMPFTGKTIFNNGADGKEGYASSFSKNEEIAQAGYYRVMLEKNAIEAELTTSDRVGFHRYRFHQGKDRQVIIDLEHRDMVLEAKLEQTGPNELSGYRHSKAWAEKQLVYFHIEFDAPIKKLTYDNSGRKAAVQFEEGDQLLVKVAISAVDEAGAKKNMETEITHWDFDKVRAESRQAWADKMKKIEVEGGSEDQMTLFYTALYHTMIAPNINHDVDGRYRGTDFGIHQDTTFINHTVFSLWDTYRSTHPLYTIIEQERTNHFIRTFLKQYQEGGRLPMWELACNFTGCMIGYHAVPTIADAYVKGIQGYDEQLALEAMMHSAMQNRLGIDAFREMGYIPSDVEPESVSKTLEYAFDDWTIAEMAKAMGRMDVADTFYRRAQHYKNVFDPGTGFMRARNNNRWVYPFDPTEVNFHYTEANSWQYSFYVPQDAETWISLLGGDEQAEKRLDDLFTASSETTGREQADITGLIGQYAHGNEPSHHIPYLYNFVGAPYKTQRLVRQIFNEMYANAPDGLSGNEDCGQMSSWLVMSAMGFYSVAPGSPQYLIGSPWFKKVKINLENGKSFIIEAPENNQENIYVESLTLNGVTYPKTYLLHDDIMKGGQLSFSMTKEPNKDFGLTKEDRPKSKIANQQLAIPALATGDRAFLEQTEVTLVLAGDGAIFYAFGANEEGIKYEKPFVIDRSTDLYVWSQLQSQKSKKAKSTFYKIPTQRSIKLRTAYANQYAAGGDIALIDFVKGTPDFRTGTWQGYEGVDVEAIVDLGKQTSINQITIGFLQDENSWIFLPEEVTFWVSADGATFEKVGTVRNVIDPLTPGVVLKEFEVTGVKRAGRFVKVMAKNRGVCPPGHKAAGGTSWLFADEITIN